MKKLLSVLLALVMVFTMTIPAFATSEDTPVADYDGYPFILVRGIDFPGLTYEDGTKALAFKPLDLAGILLEAVVGKFVHKDDEAITDGIIEYAASLLGPLASDSEGNSLNPGVSMVQYHSSMADYPDFASDLAVSSELGIVKTAVETLGAENTYFFTYDWRKNPLDVADELAALIDTAKEETGKEKVHIASASMGGMITTAYLYEYGSDDVDSVTYLSSAHNGTYVCGDAINGRIYFDSDVVYNMIMSFLGDTNFFIDILFMGLKFIGAFDIITDFLNDFVVENKDKAYGEVIRNILGTSLGLWALCPAEDIESGIEFIFGDCKDEYPVLMEKLSDVQAFRESTQATIDAAYAKGTKITFVSNYGCPLVPVYEKSDLNGDRVLETELTSNFATVAKFGETLPESALTGDASYISPDKVINANTALYKDYTWFIKGAPHVACDYGSEYSDFAFSLILSETQPTVTSFADYPQFMVADKELNLSAQ